MVTSIETVNVVIEWSLPSTDNGSPILEYKVFIIQSDGSATESATCDGSDIDIVSSATPFCKLAIEEIRAEPYTLVQADIIKAQVKARNINGWGPLSNQNTVGALVQVEPHQMSAPVNADGTS